LFYDELPPPGLRLLPALKESKPRGAASKSKVPRPTAVPPDWPWLGAPHPGEDFPAPPSCAEAARLVSGAGVAAGAGVGIEMGA
jgi:hypothetical protein